jgi:hypothetical protein
MLIIFTFIYFIFDIENLEKNSHKIENLVIFTEENQKNSKIFSNIFLKNDKIC